MILINDNWERVDDLQDISNIIREYYNSTLADKLDELLDAYEDDNYWEIVTKLDDAESEISSLEDDLSSKENEIDDLNSEIEELKDKISELEETIAELESQ